jgi:hypothetical protein
LFVATKVYTGIEKKIFLKRCRIIFEPIDKEFKYFTQKFVAILSEYGLGILDRISGKRKKSRVPRTWYPGSGASGLNAADSGSASLILRLNHNL